MTTSFSWFREAAISAADLITSNLAGVPADLRPMGMAWSMLSYTLTANAPTLYRYDEFGYMGPSPDRTAPVSPEEQRFMDDYNQRRREMNAEQRRAVDDWMRDNFMIPPLPPVDFSPASHGRPSNETNSHWRNARRCPVRC